MDDHPPLSGLAALPTLTLGHTLPDDLTLVTPTRRLAYFLRARHDTACQARGLRVWRTPEVLTWGDLLRRQFEADRLAGRTSARWLPAPLGRLVWDQLVRRDPTLHAVLAPAGLGAAAYRSWSRLHQYRIPESALGDDATPEACAFARWVHEFRHWLQQGRWLDPTLAAASVGPFATDRPLAFVGFDDWTPEQAEFLQRLHGAGVPVSLASTHEAREEDRTTAVFACNDFDAELDTAARWAARLLERQPDARIGLIVPALETQRDRVRRALDRVLVPASAFTGGPPPGASAYELAAARPLSERPVIVAALSWLAAAMAPLDLAAASELLRSSHDGGAAREAPARAELDVALRREGVRVVTIERLGSALASAGATQTAHALRALARRAALWDGSRSASAWAVEFAAALREIGWPGADPASAEYQAVERWQALLGEFAAGDDIAGSLDLASALGHLRQFANDTSFEPQTVAAPLLVIDPATAAGMQFDALWICGLDSTSWPAPAAPDPFLPRDWQVRQRLPGANADIAAATARRTLQRLTRASARTICSVPRFDGEAPLLPSALVEGWPRLEQVEQWPGIDATQALFEARPTLVRIVDGRLPAFAALEVAKGGSRLLELQANCPFRAGVELRLGARELQQPALDIEPTERGRLAHALLEAFWRDVHDHATLAAMSPPQRVARLTTLATEVFAPLLEQATDVRRELLMLEQRSTIERAGELLERDLLRAPFTVVELETPHIVDVGGVQVRVVVDRVDRLVDGSLAFIDYKTGANAMPAAWLQERPASPQLPLYVRTAGAGEVGAVAFGVLHKGETGYKGYARDTAVFEELRPFDASRAPFREYPDWKTLLTTWQHRLDALGAEHARGEARLAPDPRRACQYCHLPALCRSGQAALEVEEGVNGRE